MLKEYYEIKAQIKELEKREAVLREKLIKKGTFETREFTCQVSTNSRRSISLIEIEKDAPTIAVALDKLGLIHTNISTTVRVSLRKAA